MPGYPADIVTFFHAFPNSIALSQERKVVKIKLQQLGDGRLSHIGFYVARADPSASPPRWSLSLTDPLPAQASACAASSR